MASKAKSSSRRCQGFTASSTGSDPRPRLTWCWRTAEPHELSRAATSWLTQAHPCWGVVVAGPAESIEAATAALVSAGVAASAHSHRFLRRQPRHRPVSPRAVAVFNAATAEHLIIMESLAAGLTHDWLTRLIGYSDQSHIAAAGPVVLASDGRIQHAGIALPEMPLPIPGR